MSNRDERDPRMPRTSLPTVPPSEHAVTSRREFVKLAGLAVVALTGACPGRPPEPDGGGLDGGSDASVPETGAPDANVTGLPTLGGAPNTAQGRTIAAFCDTVIPGRYRDPMGKPGAIDTNTPAMFFDPVLPAAPLVPLLTLLLDSASRGSNGGRLFAYLTPDEREATLIAAVASVPELEFGIQLVKLGFYSSDAVRDYLGYPGSNTGYAHDPDFTFARPMATERTTDGNLP